ncbi:hypothetical protein PENANT_c243G04756, partial [Penicillium antarcticum]
PQLYSVGLSAHRDLPRLAVAHRAAYREPQLYSVGLSAHRDLPRLAVTHRVATREPQLYSVGLSARRDLLRLAVAHRAATREPQLYSHLLITVYHLNVFTHRIAYCQSRASVGLEERVMTIYPLLNIGSD